MRNKYKKLILIIFVFNILTGCQSLKDALEGNKKTKSAEEFLIQKKKSFSLTTRLLKITSTQNWF